MGQLETYKALVQRAVQDTLEAGVVEAQELDAAAAEQATRGIRDVLANASEFERRDIEYVFHTLLFDLSQALQPSGGQQSQELRVMLAAIDAITALCDKGLLDPPFIFILLEEIMDMVTVPTARDIFQHLEKRASVLRKGMTATGGKGILMLKMCNALLKRIPHSTMSEFAGRVQLFVANSFSLSERSGVNLRGDFDQEHIPVLSETVDNEEDQKLYRSFWSLQRYFANPQLVFGGKDESLGEFYKAAKLTLDEFRKAGNGTSSNHSHAAAAKPTGKESLKYLTSPRLLHMQFTDAQFKCQVVVQLMIFIKYMLSMTGEKLKALKETATNKFVIPTNEISKDDQQALRELQDRASNQLFAIANDRGLLRRSTLFVLIHDNNWVKWKAGSCKPFEGVPLPDLLEEMQNTASDFFNIREAQYSAESKPMGSTRMAELWDNTNIDIASLEGLGNETRDVDLVSTLTKLEEYCRTDNDYEFLMRKEQSAADLLQWRSLRLAVHENVFRAVDPASKSLEKLRAEVIVKEEEEEEEQEKAKANEDVEMVEADPVPEPATTATTVTERDNNNNNSNNNTSSSRDNFDNTRIKIL